MRRAHGIESSRRRVGRSATDADSGRLLKERFSSWLRTVKAATFDFLFPTHVWMVDPSPWNAIVIPSNNTAIKLQKPISEQSTYSVAGSTGNNPLDAFSTIIRLELSSDTVPDGQLLYPIALECLNWIRALTRQYWVGFAGSGTAPVRGSSLVTDASTGEEVPTNFGAIRTPIVPEALSKEIWEKLGQALAVRQFPRTSDLILCNGMLALRDGNLREAVALLGIACEVELGECLKAFLSKRNDAVANLLYKSSRQGFAWKLTKLLPELSGKDFSKDAPHWASKLNQLYEARGAAAHSNLKPEVGAEVPGFLHAADAFLVWTHELRSSHKESLGPCPLRLRATIG